MKTPDYLSAGNEKLRRSGIYSWGIPAYRSESGMLTCPGAQSCIVGCYARQGRYVMPNVKAARERNLELSLSGSSEFIEAIDAEIKRRGVKILRIHDSGDFYDRRYLNNWIEIMKRNPGTRFYAYTKMIPLFDSSRFPQSDWQIPNFTVIFSFGGRWDGQIDPAKDRHSVVFESQADRKRAGYADATRYDIRALGQNHRIGLVYHGANARAWSVKP